MTSVRELLDLSGRKALITGGAGHIGREISNGLQELGCRVSSLDQVKSTEPGVSSFVCDLSSETDTRACARSVIKKMKGLDVLIHCAAFVGTTKMTGWAAPFHSQSVKAWDAALRVNLTSPFVLAQECRGALKKSGHGSIILFSSIYGMTGPDFRIYEKTPMQSPAGYGASKGGLLQLSRYLATLFAPEIRVNAISPGGVWRNQPRPFQKKYIDRTPLKRMATETDLKGAVAYLASDMSSYMTGHNLVLDGGWTAW